MILRVSRFMGQSPEATLAMDDRWWFAALRAEAEDWPQQTELLAQIVDALNTLIFVTVKLERPKAQMPAPKPLRRPWEKAKQVVRMSPLEFARTQVPLGRRRGGGE